MYPSSKNKAETTAEQQHKNKIIITTIMRYSPEVFKYLGLQMMGYNPNRCRSEATTNRRFRSGFGTSWEICADVWNMLVEIKHPIMSTRGAENVHILWALMLLKTYQTESVIAARCNGASEKTFRKWPWLFIVAISDLASIKVRMKNKNLNLFFFTFSSQIISNSKHLLTAFNKIQLSDRFEGDKGYDCLMSVDGADFMIEEPWPYKKGASSKWYTSKYDGAGLRYEVGVSILGGKIVWINGPLLPGKYNDHTIFKNKGLLSHLEDGERVETDDGYIFLDPEFTKARSSIFHPEDMKDLRNTVRARHETINRRMKVFKILANKFHHSDLGKHQDCFNAVAVLVQFALERKEQIWDIEYKG